MSENGQTQPTIHDAVDPDALVRPVAAGSADYPAGFRIAPHRHRSAQLVYASAGVMVVATADGTWVVPPERAVWVPAETEHRIRMRGAVAMRTLYIAPGAAPWLPEACCVVAVPPLLRALILEAMGFEAAYPEAGPEARLMAVILDRIGALDVVPLHLPAARDRRLRSVTDALATTPGDGRTLAQWAETAGASARTLARLFHRETGLTFHRWRQQARLMTALARLAAGEPVTTVALDLGYDSPSAFIAMFKKALGTTPGRYFARST